MQTTISNNRNSEYRPIHQAQQNLSLSKLTGITMVLIVLGLISVSDGKLLNTQTEANNSLTDVHVSLKAE